MMSMGHRYTLVIASATKMALQTQMPDEMRLDFLSHLEKMTDAVLTPEIIGLVDPMDNKGWELYSEAIKLGYGRNCEPGPNAFTVLHDKFDVFASLNPSLRKAYDEACKPWRG